MVAPGSPRLLWGCGPAGGVPGPSARPAALKLCPAGGPAAPAMRGDSLSLRKPAPGETRPHPRPSEPTAVGMEFWHPFSSLSDSLIATSQGKLRTSWDSS